MFFPAGRLLARFACHGAVHGHCRNAKGAVQAPPPAPAPPSARHGLCTAAAAISERRPTARPREFIGRSCRTSTRERRSRLEGSSGRLMAVGIPGLDPVSPGGLRPASVPPATGRISPWARQLCREGPPGLPTGHEPIVGQLSSRYSQPSRKPSGAATVTATNHTVFDYFSVTRLNCCSLSVHGGLKEIIEAHSPSSGNFGFGGVPRPAQQRRGLAARIPMRVETEVRVRESRLRGRPRGEERRKRLEAPSGSPSDLAAFEAPAHYMSPPVRGRQHAVVNCRLWRVPLAARGESRGSGLVPKRSHPVH